MKVNEDIKKYMGIYGAYVPQEISSDYRQVKVRGDPIVGSSGIFACCGARQLTGMASWSLSSELARQEFFLALLSAKSTIYFLPTTTQMREYSKRSSSVINLLFSVGAKEVYASPNRLHGPNNLHLCVLDLKSPECLEAQKKMLFKIKTKDQYGYEATRLIPMEIAKRCGLVETDETGDPVSATPFRDTFGRFAKRV